ncbi:hypothetical protein H310_05870 [Aphanomyces invadans]|uniref:Uncharacterized protein n=1 Tax=Aphanomyces invadans TaxID=157072 RepID=A0A024U8X8_9STRA|nr:hypothetical protein H310_05870 [Aphanomyces invadans]ETW02327.1 hypothetical protein H310_05870 [Aphanomyces invadans]|eukprot:XP_008868932.1 hypothetical protein H310_05870 [Aphanomyces invadans]
MHAWQCCGGEYESLVAIEFVRVMIHCDQESNTMPRACIAILHVVVIWQLVGTPVTIPNDTKSTAACHDGGKRRHQQRATRGCSCHGFPANWTAASRIHKNIRPTFSPTKVLNCDGCVREPS